MKVIISFEKKHLYFFLFGIGVIILFGFVMAYNSVYGGGYPSVLGHSADELKVNISGNYKTLQEAIDNQDLSAWTKSGNDISYNNGNVGIGTTGAPLANLHINGWTRIGTIPAESIQFETQGTFHRVAFDELKFYDWTTGGDMVTFKDGDVSVTGTINTNYLTTPGATQCPSGWDCKIRTYDIAAQSGRFYGDVIGTRLCIGEDCRNGWPSGGSGGDNLGNHIASQDLNMVGRNIVNTGNIEMAGGTLKLSTSNSPPYACDGSKLGRVYFDTSLCWGGGSCPYGVIQVPCACVEWRTGTADYRWATLFDPEVICD